MGARAMPGDRTVEPAAIEAGLQCLADMIAAEGGAGPIPPAAADALSAAIASSRPPEMPKGLVARPVPMPPARWHFEHVLQVAPHDAAGRARRMYHARLLGFLLAPERPEFRPVVTVLIPVFNRAASCALAVESCLAQSWRPLEILVIDDGSTDDLATALRPFGADVRLLRKPNGGVSSARNMGIAAARGDFIHFLDSDDLLLPGAIARKVEAFAAIADAELCYSGIDYRGFPPGDYVRVQPPSGRRGCPTTDLMRAVAHRFPFFLSTVMLPRWIALEVGAFEEDLRRSEDRRYYLALGRRGAKAIGLVDPLTMRVFSRDGLTGSGKPEPTLVALVWLRQLRDVLDVTAGWRYAGIYLARVVQAWRQAASNMSDPLVEQAVDDVLVAARRLAGSQRRDGLSALPLIASLRHCLESARAAGRWHPDAGDRLMRELPRLLDQAAEEAAPLAAADLAFWADRSGHRDDRPPIARCMRILERRYRGDAAILQDATWLLRRSKWIPDKRAIVLLVHARRWLGSIGLARRIALLFHRYARSSA